MLRNSACSLLVSCHHSVCSVFYPACGLCSYCTNPKHPNPNHVPDPNPISNPKPYLNPYLKSLVKTLILTFR